MFIRNITTVLNGRTLTLSVSPVSVSCVRGGILNHSERTYEHVCDFVTYCSSLKSLNILVQGDVGILRALLITSALPLLPHEPFCSFHCHLLPRLLSLSPALSSIRRPVLHFHPLTSYFPPVPTIHKVILSLCYSFISLLV